MEDGTVGKQVSRAIRDPAVGRKPPCHPATNLPNYFV
jgi:hypothetical protein